VRLIDDLLADSQSERRFSMLLLSSFAGIALLLAVVGIYGVISYVVSSSTQEVGVRMALGAQKDDLLKMVIGNGIRLVLVGMAIGIAGALVLTRLLSSLLFGVARTDPATFVVVALLLLSTALLACYIPARRATRVDPMTALRFE
jgi:ABC-type antimicrobial peptide transport system permease subunit